MRFSSPSLGMHECGSRPAQWPSPIFLQRVLRSPCNPHPPAWPCSGPRLVSPRGFLSYSVRASVQRLCSALRLALSRPTSRATEDYGLRLCNAGEAVLAVWLLDKWFHRPFTLGDLS